MEINCFKADRQLCRGAASLTSRKALRVLDADDNHDRKNFSCQTLGKAPGRMTAHMDLDVGNNFREDRDRPPKKCGVGSSPGLQKMHEIGTAPLGIGAGICFGGVSARSVSGASRAEEKVSELELEQAEDVLEASQVDPEVVAAARVEPREQASISPGELQEEEGGSELQEQFADFMLKYGGGGSTGGGDTGFRSPRT